MMRVSLLAAALLVGVSTSAAGQTQKHDCNYCHNIHGGSYQALTDSATSQALCEGCHGDLGPATWLGTPIPKDVAIHDGAKHSGPTSCWNCHDHEGEATPNLSLIPQSRTGAAGGATRSIVFTARTGPNSFADGDATYDGVCEVCHSLTNYHRFDGSGSGGAHNGQADCTTCHKHAEGFKGGGACTSCHNTTQGSRRAVLDDFGRTSHHVDWQAAGYAAADSIPETDCQTCHDQSQHQQGTVRLWNVDAPGDTLQAIVLTGDPMTSSTEGAKLETFCINCHDADGAAGDTVPFSDGIVRPEIDATVWPVSSHGTALSISAGCFGDGASGCHATGHGSEKRKLLTPWATAASSPSLTEEEEGFCFGCHDSGGPGPDVKSGYDTSPLWADGGVQLGPANLNDRHDVTYADQQATSRRIECASCHDPHTANTSNVPISLLRRDPDPTDGRVPGSGWFADSSLAETGTSRATDAISEWCLDCHDGSWAPGVQDSGATKIVDILHGAYTGGTGSAWYENSHGAGPSGASLKGTGNPAYYQLDDVVSCLSCHQVHPDTTAQQVTTTLFNNLFAMKDTIFGKDWITVIPADDGASYEISTLTARKNDNVNSYYLCNTCHTGSMGSGKQNCFSCHVHGDNRF